MNESPLRSNMGWRRCTVNWRSSTCAVDPFHWPGSVEVKLGLFSILDRGANDDRKPELIARPSNSQRLARCNIQSSKVPVIQLSTSSWYSPSLIPNSPVSTSWLCWPTQGAGRIGQDFAAEKRQGLPGNHVLPVSGCSMLRINADASKWGSGRL